MADLDVRPLRETSGDFLDYLDEWKAGLPSASLDSLIAEAGGPEHVGIFCVDVINGFCHEGPLHSKRVQKIIAPIADLFARAYEKGVRHFVLAHDAHDPDAPEFASYPPHCLRGSHESEIVPELLALPFASEFQLFPKNCIHSAVGTGLNAWLDARPDVTHRIVVGDCTDLCTYHLAMYLKVRANAANRLDPVILPVNCVDTYDVPVGIARAENLPAHPADLLHTVFLYNMVRNNVTLRTALT